VVAFWSASGDCRTGRRGHPRGVVSVVYLSFEAPAGHSFAKSCYDFSPRVVVEASRAGRESAWSSRGPCKTCAAPV
jgi:hypothetical protein